MIPQTPEQRISALETALQQCESANTQLRTQLQQQAEELKVQLYTDRVTGLRTKQALYETVEKSGYPTLFLIRLNDIDRYFDLYGYEVVNEILQRFSQILITYNSNKDYQLYHLSTDLFGMLYLGEFIDTQKFEDDLFELMSTVDENPLFLAALDEVFYVDMIIGIASGETQLIKHAFDALHSAKSTKKRFVYYHPHHDQSDKHRTILHVKREIQSNIESGNFLPLYQPIVDRESRCIKYEVLIRMRHNGELISPAYFLDIASKTHQYEQISAMTLLSAIEAFKNRTEKLSLNFTLADISHKELLRSLEKKLQAYNMGRRCVFEIVESEAIGDYDAIRSFVSRFRKLGVQFAIDDFGSGYSNYSHILELEPEYLKIDGSLIKNIQNDYKSHILVNSIIYFAKHLGVKIIAEYVASESIFTLLHGLGIDEFQGYYFGKPDTLP